MLLGERSLTRQSLLSRIFSADMARNFFPQILQETCPSDIARKEMDLVNVSPTTCRVTKTSPAIMQERNGKGQKKERKGKENGVKGMNKIGSNVVEKWILSMCPQ